MTTDVTNSSCSVWIDRQSNEMMAVVTAVDKVLCHCRLKHNSAIATYCEMTFCQTHKNNTNKNDEQRCHHMKNWKENERNGLKVLLWVPPLLYKQVNWPRLLIRCFPHSSHCQNGRRMINYFNAFFLLEKLAKYTFFKKIVSVVDFCRLRSHLQLCQHPVMRGSQTLSYKSEPRDVSLTNDHHY